MLKTPASTRVHISFVGKRNVGKSSLINAISNQSISIVSDIAGTTTDPVKKTMEIAELGPVYIIDTAGIDDVGQLGEQRVKKTYTMIRKSDVIIYVTTFLNFDNLDMQHLQKLKKQGHDIIIVFNKIDIHKEDKTIIKKIKEKFKNIDITYTDAIEKKGIDKLKKILLKFKEKVRKITYKSIIGDLIKGGDIVILVVPIDLGAPAGRLILPQVQVLRDTLDNDAIALTVKERELYYIINQLKTKPKLVITDSQVIMKIAGDVPKDINLTTFSILFSRLKGDLQTFVDGVKTIDKLEDKDKVLIAEACTHHPLADDIARVKIPRWIRQYTGKDIQFDINAGFSYPENLQEYKLVIHCGGCMINRKEMLYRMNLANEEAIPITNYGVTISYVHGLLQRALQPFKYIIF